MMTDRHGPLLARPRAWQGLFAAALLLGGLWVWASRSDGALDIPPAPRPNAPAPAFTVTTLAGEEIALADLHGQAVVLNLWAMWCPPCRAEMPDFERVWQRYADEDVVFLAVNQGETAADIAAFQAEIDETMTFPIALDPDFSVSDLYEVDSFPTTFFIDKRGVIREVVVSGPLSEAEIESKLRAVMRK